MSFQMYTEFVVISDAYSVEHRSATDFGVLSISIPYLRCRKAIDTNLGKKGMSYEKSNTLRG